MLRKIFLIGCTALAIGTMAQSYRPLPEANAGWVEWHGWEQPYALSTNCQWQTLFSCERTIRFGPDTTITGQSYHSLYRHGQCSYQMVGATQPYPGCPWSGSYTEPTTLLGFLRQDSDDRQVFWYDTGMAQGQLLYDFNMGLGALPTTYNNPWSGQIQVTSMDSVLLVDGYHKRWILDVPFANDTAFVIEGVGSSFGLVNLMSIGIESGTSLSCFARNDSLIYPTSLPAWSHCDMEVGLEPNDPSKEYAAAISPNPGNTHFTLQLPGGMHTIEVFDATGRRVLGMKTPDVRAVVHTEALPSGIYIVHLTNGSGTGSVLRWVKQ